MPAARVRAATCANITRMEVWYRVRQRWRSEKASLSMALVQTVPRAEWVILAARKRGSRSRAAMWQLVFCIIYAKATSFEAFAPKFCTLLQFCGTTSGTPACY